MAINVTLQDVATLQNNSIVAAINANNALIQNAFLDCLSLSGTTPNTMSSNLDMNGNQILNLPAPATINSPIRVQDVSTTDGVTASLVGLLAGMNTWTGVNTFTNTVSFPGISIVGTGLLTIDANAAGSTPGVLPTGTVLHLIGPDTANVRFILDAFGGFAVVSARRANGTATSPTPVNGGDALFSYGASGWDGTQYANGNNASISITALNGWSITDHSTNILFLTTAGGTTVQSERLRIWGSGGISINNIVDPGIGNLSVTGIISGTSIQSTPIGSITTSTGAFTTLSASSTVSGTGFSTYFASPPSIGSITPSSGAFTTLSASSTVSGSGFSTYLASPPAIGGTSAAAGTFTALKATTLVTPSTASALGSSAITSLSADNTGSTYSARFANSSTTDVLQIRGDSVVVVIGTLTNIGSGGIAAGSGGFTTSKAVFMTSTLALTNNAAAATATLTNSPTAGNPTKWIPINDNGTTRNIPCW